LEGNPITTLSASVDWMVNKYLIFD